MDVAPILNSPLVNKLLRFGLSKSGIFVTAAVAYLITHFGIDKIVPADNLPEIKKGLEAGGFALIAMAYAWVTSRQKAGVKAIQSAINASENSPVTVKVDGIAGNASVFAAAKVADVPIKTALAGAGKP